MARNRIEVELIGDSSSLERSFRRANVAASGFNRSMTSSNRASGIAQKAHRGLGRTVLLAGGAMLGGQGIIAGITSTLTKTAQYERSLNILGQTTHAGGQQMKAAGALAQQLGGDITLPATSAKDAAEAMVELAKGGLDLSSSMAAAKGTLQLAAAGHLDAAQAAQIQVNALSQFGLSGDKAALVADVLANAANAASGEVTDMATALSYVGPIAGGMGISITDTATAVGLLAKNGILGEKAGTGLRGIIGSLANPSTKAAEGIRQLGLHVFDAKGHFVGLRALTDQLAVAQGHMTKQQFAANAAAAFGREPLAAIFALAKEGGPAYDKMAVAVGKQGGASRIAAAHNKGLGGAMDGLKSAVESLQIKIGLVLAPAITRLLTRMSTWLGKTKNQKAIMAQLTTVGHTVVTMAHALRSAFQALNSITGSTKNTVKLLLGVFVAIKALSFASSIAGIGRNLGLIGKGAAGATGKVALLRSRLVGLVANPYVATIAVVAIGAEVVAAKIKALQNMVNQAESRTFKKGDRVETTLVPQIASEISARKAAGQKAPEILTALRKRLGTSAVSDDLISEAFQFRAGTVAGLNKRIDKQVDDVANHAKRKLAAVKRKPTSETPFVVDPKTDTKAAKAAAAAAKKAREAAAAAVERANTAFDTRISRSLNRVQDVSDLGGQDAALTRIAAQITARIAKTRDVTRRMTLEDQLLDVIRQQKGIRQQRAADAMDSLQFGFEQAQTTVGFTDDMAALTRIDAQIRARIKAEGNTLELRRQLFANRQQQAAVKLSAANAKAFGALGLSGTGDILTPQTGDLRKLLGTAEKSLRGTFLDDKEHRSVMGKIRKVLSGQLGTLSEEVRAKVKEMLDAVVSETDQVDRKLKRASDGFDKTLGGSDFSGANAAANAGIHSGGSIQIVGPGGLNPGLTQAAVDRLIRRDRLRGSTPAAASRGLSTAMRTDVHTTINLDGQTVARTVTKHQAKAAGRGAVQTRGPTAGR